MMPWAPKALGPTTLDPQTLAEDLKGCQKVGPCGIGRRALYLNSFCLSRRYYVSLDDLQRCFKRIAMSRGGFSGKGIFGSMPYLVVELSDGREKQCNFKYEDQVDRFLAIMQESRAYDPPFMLNDEGMKDPLVRIRKHPIDCSDTFRVVLRTVEVRLEHDV